MPCLVVWRPNGLFVNPTKTQFIWVGIGRLANVDWCLIAETFPDIVFCDLGIILDQLLNFQHTLINFPVVATLNFASCVLFLVPCLVKKLTSWSMLLLLIGSVCCSVLFGLPLMLTAGQNSPSLRCAPHWGAPKHSLISRLYV